MNQENEEVKTDEIVENTETVTESQVETANPGSSDEESKA